MNCKKCGAPILEGDQFCKGCGAAVNEQNAQNNIESNQNNFNNVNQQMNMSQPMNNYNNGTSYQPSYQPSQNNSTKYILIGIGAVILIGLVILIFILTGKKETVTTPNENLNNGGTTVVNNTSTYKVNFSNFTFNIPNDYIYTTQDNVMLLTDSSGSWAVGITIIDGAYSKLLINKNSLQKNFEKDGYTSNAAVEKTIKGRAFITTEISKSGNNMLTAYSDAGMNMIFTLVIYTTNNNYDYDILEKVADILNDAKYNATSNSITTTETIDFNMVKELAQ